MGLLAAGTGRRCTRRLRAATWMARLRDSLCDAPASRLLAASGRVRSRAFLTRAKHGPAEVRLHPVWRRPATVHRRSVCPHRNAVERRHVRAAVPPSPPARSSGGPVAAHHAAAAVRHAHDHRTPDALELVLTSSTFSVELCALNVV